MRHMRFGLARLVNRPAAGYALAISLVLVALGLRLALEGVLPAGFPFLLFFPPVIITTYIAGLGPGMLTVVLSAVAAAFFFIPPEYSFRLESGGMAVLALYTLVMAMDIALIQVMSVALRRLDQERQRSAELSHQARVMFAELQHRVSNNLQLISSLLQLQTAKVRDPDAVRALDEARARVATLGRLHRMLHNPAEQDVDMADYLHELCRELLDAAGARHVQWSVAAEPVRLSHDRLVPTALIVAELLSNALEHGFPDGRPGHISVALQPSADGHGFCVAVRDDGAGLPATFRLEEQTSLGLRIVRTLAAQIGGTVTMESDGGTVCTLCVA